MCVCVYVQHLYKLNVFYGLVYPNEKGIKKNINKSFIKFTSYE